MPKGIYPRKRIDVIDRINRRTVYPESGCWIWNGATVGDGYGYINETHEPGKLQLIHRISYRRFIGLIPEGHDVHHKCENTRCWNPDHLQMISKPEHGTLSAKSRPNYRIVCPHCMREGALAPMTRHIANCL